MKSVFHERQLKGYTVTTGGHNPLAILLADIATVIGDRSRNPQRISFTWTFNSNGIDNADLEQLNNELREMFRGVYRIRDVDVVRSATETGALDVRISRPLSPVT